MSVPRRVTATRYVTPLREGGSLPGLVEGDDDGMYVCKFRGAGQGPRVLVAEMIVGRTAQGLGLPVPELVVLHLDDALGRAEPDPEIQALMRASTGLNLGMDFLPGALGWDPSGRDPVDADTAAEVVWLDAFALNVDRTPRNPNLLVWHGRTWLIDHGAALYPQHADWALTGAEDRTLPDVGAHVLLRLASSVADADARLVPRCTDALLRDAVDAVPEEWLQDEPGVAPAARREAYLRFLTARRDGPRAFAREAEVARAAR
ncbi:MAG: HipA family kinase [Thermoleophilia bacterium]